MKKLGSITFHLITFAILSLFTQIGGIIWLIAVFIHRQLGAWYRFPFRRALIFTVLYLISVVSIVPALAQLSSRIWKNDSVSHNMTNSGNRDARPHDMTTIFMCS